MALDDVIPGDAGALGAAVIRVVRFGLRDCAAVATRQADIDRMVVFGPLDVAAS